MRSPTYLRRRGSQHIRRAGRAPGDHVAHIVDAQWLSPGVRRLRFRCEAIDPAWTAGDRLLVRVCQDSRRYYTIASIDHARQRFDVVAVAHPYGAGGRWASTAEVGETTVVFGPKPDLDVRIDGAREAVLLGDETAVGLFEAIRSGRQRRVPVRGAIEHGRGVGLTSEPGALEGLDILAREGAPGARLHGWAHAYARAEPRTVYFVVGHGAAVRSLRLALLAMGIRGAAIRSRAYWGRAASTVTRAIRASGSLRLGSS